MIFNLQKHSMNSLWFDTQDFENILCEQKKYLIGNRPIRFEEHDFSTVLYSTEGAEIMEILFSHPDG